MLKPSEQNPLTTLKLAELVAELAASVFTESSRRGLDVPSTLDFGTVW